MPYLQNINSYLYQSSLLLQAYPNTTRITTKYSLPRTKQSRLEKPSVQVPAGTHEAADVKESSKLVREQQPPAATLTFKTFEPRVGICLKYQTNKSAEVGRLMTGLGTLAKGEQFEESSTAVGIEATEAKPDDTMDIETPTSRPERALDGNIGGRKPKKRKGKR